MPPKPSRQALKKAGLADPELLVAQGANERVFVVAHQAAQSSRIAERAREPQHPGRVGPAVDEVAQQHDLALGLGDDALGGGRSSHGHRR